MRRAIILGSGSDIGCGIAERLERDGWRVDGYHHYDPVESDGWDLIVCCYGMLGPIGEFWHLDWAAWERSLEANALQPLRQVQQLYSYRRPDASVCFFSGAGSNGPAPTYSAYAASKIMLTKMVELMDAESEDLKVFILGPGMVKTKIQQQTLRAGPDRAANYERVSKFMGSDSAGTSMDDIYDCLMACHAASKEAVGGRNIYVPLDDWCRLEELRGNPDMFKLRRAGDDQLRKEKK